ncbi:MAG TPA: general stress protein [Cellulomonas sp.]
MSMSSSANRVPRVPTLPQGEAVASYVTYLEAQKAVDHLADSQFPVQHVTIVGSDLKSVERVLRRLSYPSVAIGGFASGAWFGLFVGLILTLFSSSALGLMIPAVLFGGAFGLLFSVITYAFTRGRRDFTSSSQIVASTYSVLCAAEHAGQARQLLAAVGGVVSGWPGAVPSAPVGPTSPFGAPPSSATAAYPGPPTPPAPPAPPTA